MAYTVKKSLTLTTDNTSGATGYLPSEGFLNGSLINIVYHPGSTPFSTNCDVTVTVEGTTQTVLNLVNISAFADYVPRQNIQSTTGGSTAAGGVPFVLANERLKVTVSNASTGTSGTFTAIVQ
jgi:hypothetical protein